jgi:heat shock protein HtpX
MRRRPLSSDPGLTVRMSVVLALIALIYGSLLFILGAALVYGLVVDDMALAGDSTLLLATTAALIVYGILRADRRALAAVGSRRAAAEQPPDLQLRIERLAAQGGIPSPHLAIVASEAPNAFAVGYSARHATIVLTAGLLDLLTPRCSHTSSPISPTGMESS